MQRTTRQQQTAPVLPTPCQPLKLLLTHQARTHFHIQTPITCISDEFVILQAALVQGMELIETHYVHTSLPVLLTFPQLKDRTSTQLHLPRTHYII